MNRADLVAAVAATPDGGTLTIPAGVHTVDMNEGPIPVSRSISIVGAGIDQTVIDVVAPTVASDLFSITAPNRSRVHVADLTVNGPTTGASPLSDGIGCFRWSLYKTADSMFSALRVKVTGQFDAAFGRSGGGIMVVDQCQLNAWEAPVKFFASHGEYGRLILTGNHLSGVGSKNSSIGVYVHSHIDVTSARNHYDTFARFGIYSNGGKTPVPGQTWVSIGDTFTNCSLTQTPLSIPAAVFGATSYGTTGPGSLIKGDLTVVASQLGPQRLTFPAGSNVDLEVVDTVFTPTGIPFIAGGAGRFRFTGCVWNIAGSGRILSTSDVATSLIDMGDSVINDLGSSGPWLLRTLGPVTLNWNRATLNSSRDDALWYAPSTTVIGAPA